MAVWFAPACEPHPYPCERAANPVELISHPDQLEPDFHAGAISIGNFDGIHAGHARIIRQLVRLARQQNGPSLVFTFDPHPIWLLRPELAPVPLMDIPTKAGLLAELGVDLLLVYPTDRRLLELSAAAFFQQIVRGGLRARGMVEGPNFYFGRDRQGDLPMLKSLCQQHGVALRIVEPVEQERAIVSSSRIRSLLQAGDVESASRMLQRPYRIRGQVQRGAARGTGLGFPTANLGDLSTLVPGPGVYAGRGELDGQHWPAAIHIGPNPTFAEDQLKVEAHLLDFSGPPPPGPPPAVPTPPPDTSLYGRTLALDFIQRLRNVVPFDSADSLRAQLRQDVQATRETYNHWQARPTAEKEP